MNDNIIETANACFARRHLVNVPCFNVKWMQGREQRLAQFEWPKFRYGILEVYNEIKKQGETNGY